MDRVLNSARQLDNLTWNLRQEIRMIEWEQRKKLVRIVGPNIQRLKHVFGPGDDQEPMDVLGTLPKSPWMRS